VKATAPSRSDPRTTRLYDGREERVTRNLVERISINLSDLHAAGVTSERSEAR